MWKTIRLIAVAFLMALTIILLRPTDVTAIENERLVFDSTQPVAEYRWNLNELKQQMPSDWTSMRFLVMEMKASSPQRFQVQLHTPQGVSALYVHPLQNAWVRAVLPLEMFTRSTPRSNPQETAFLNPQQITHFMFHTESFVPLDNIEAIAIAMPEPLEKPTLEIRSIRLTKDFPGNAVLEDEPLVDEFGQWMQEQWPKKITRLDELQSIWRQEEQQLQPQPSEFDYCKYGGYCSTQAKATGFFHTQLIDEKWWLVDPEGHLFFSTGINAITPTEGTPIEGRTSIYKQLPPQDLLTASSSRTSSRASFYLWNIARRFGENWTNAWVDMTARRMQAWGFNTVANWSYKELNQSSRLPYVLPIDNWETQQSYLTFPDVYSEEFIQVTEATAAEKCAPHKNDPFLIGYFVRNEPPWPRNEETIVQLILDGPDTAIQRELKTYLSAGDTPERRKAFFYTAYDRYLQVIKAAIRKHDPNHLILGIRFAGYAPDEMVKASGIFDVFSLNDYEYILSQEEIERYQRLSGLPVLIGEFHFGVPGRGMSAGLKQVRDQNARGVAYRYYVENAAAMPGIIGTHWFQWADQPPTGRRDGENYNIGVVDVTDRPYPELVEAMQATHGRLYAIHSGQASPVSQKALIH